MRIPNITHLQFKVLTALLDGEQSGRRLREMLARAGHESSAPAFYQFMARLEDAGLVEGRYESKVVEGQALKERRYKVTADGIAAVEEVQAFYLQAAAERLGYMGT